MRKIILVLLIISGFTLILVALSVKTFPVWLSIPGGLLILLGVAFSAVLDVGSKIKDWVDLLFKKDSNIPNNKTQINYSNINQQGGSNIIASKIDHLEVHNNPPRGNKRMQVRKRTSNQIIAKQAKLIITGKEREKDRSPHIEVSVINGEKKTIICRAKCHAIYNSLDKNIKREISDYANHFSWSGGSDKGSKIIPAGLDGIINLVRTTYAGSGIAFLFDENTNSYWIDEGVYKIDLEIVGMIDDGIQKSEFIGKRVRIEFQYKKNEKQDAYGHIVNNGELKLITYTLKS
jgi:hypothetical protein